MKAAFVDVTPEMIVKATHGLDPKSHGLSPPGQPARFPLVFAFGTRGGNLGVLEIRGFSDDRKLVKFRYKLVRPDDRGRTATRPPPAVPPAEIQRETIDETIHKLFALAAAGSPAAQPIGRPTAAHLERIAEAPRVASILNGTRDGSPAKQDAIRAAVLREYQQHAEPTWCNSPAGSVAAYAWQSFLDRMPADPQRQAQLKPEQAAVLRAYQQYREATKAQGEFLYPSEMMRFAGEFAVAGQPQARQEVAKPEQPAFESLKLRISTQSSRIRENSGDAAVARPRETPPNSHEFGYAQLQRFESLLIEVSGFWPGQRTISIRGDGKYTFDMKDYRAAYQLKPEHMRQLSELLKGTDWLTMAAGRAMADDVTTYTLTLDRDGRKTKVAAEDIQQAPYKELSVLESLQADDDPFVRGAVADALLTAPSAAAIPILHEMAADSRPAAWALIRLGDKAESAIVEILTEPTFRSSGPGHVIREYYEHWKELPAPPSAAIVKAIRYRVQADAKDGPFDKYGLDVLKLAGAPLEEVKR
jgi:hypothetical protein